MTMSEDRAERLGISMLIFGLVLEPASAALAALAEVPLLTEGELEIWREGDDEDIALTNACLQVEYGLRAEQWRALMLLDIALHGPPVVEPPPPPSGRTRTVRAHQGSLPVSTPDVVVVPRAAVERLARVVLGWNLPNLPNLPNEG